MLADYFADLFMWLLHSVTGLCTSVYLCSDWYQCLLFIFSASFGSSCNAGLVVTNFLRICLSEKDLISPLLMRISLAEYKILYWNFFFKEY